jgi:hypothetical protein
MSIYFFYSIVLDKKKPFSNEKWGVVRVMMISIWKILFILRALNEERKREKDLVHPSIDIFYGS